MDGKNHDNKIGIIITDVILSVITIVILEEIFHNWMLIQSKVILLCTITAMVGINLIVFLLITVVIFWSVWVVITIFSIIF